jgi:S-methylmethionine-dependent homocysteine/selenocysteine methylase
MLEISKSNNPFSQAKQNSSPLILDGAIGSYLQQKGFQADNIIWTTNINHSNPDVIIRIHLEYLNAGADIITTNTFRTNPSAMLKAGINDCANYVKEAVKLAMQSAGKKKNILIAGSNPPAEDCYQMNRSITYKELEFNHKYHIDLLIDSGVNFILNETQSHLDEIIIIADHCDQKNIPYVVSFYLDSTLKILSRESLYNIFSLLKDHNPLAIGINCIAPEVFSNLLSTISLPELWGFYLNCGSGNQTDKEIICGVMPDKYIEIVKSNLDYIPSFIGSCCGSNPEHTRKIKELLNG